MRFLGFGFGATTGVDKVSDIEVAGFIAGNKQLRRGESDFGKGQRQPEDRAQLKVAENLLHAQGRITGWVVEFEAVDAQAQHEGIEFDLFDAQIGVKILLHRLHQVFLQQPGNE